VNLLEGSIAFTLAMAGLATLCTVLIEILHRVAGLRSSGLRKMLEAYFDDVIKPGLAPGADLAGLRANLMDTLTQSGLMGKIQPKDGSNILGIYRKRLLQANAVTTEEFLQRLPDTDLFKQWQAKSAEEAKAQLERLVDKYGQYGAAASDYFKRRAQLLSLLMGIALALFGNIHALRIFDTFVKNPELAQRMQAQAGAIQAGIERQPPQAAEAGADATAELEKVKNDLAAINTSLAEYQKMGLPIGWNYYPNCLGSGAGDARCQALKLESKDGETHGSFCSVATTLWHDLGTGLLWLFTVLFSGILIGLGGPFWYNVAMSLSKAKQAFGGLAPAQPETVPRLSARDQAMARAVGQLAPAASVAQNRQPWEDKPW